jgi:hypothetical protein
MRLKWFLNLTKKRLLILWVTVVIVPEIISLLFITLWSNNIIDTTLLSTITRYLWSFVISEKIIIFMSLILIYKLDKWSYNMNFRDVILFFLPNNKRINREQYIYLNIFIYSFCCLGIPILILFENNYNLPFILFSIFYITPYILYNIYFKIIRFHDLNKSGLFCLIPIYSSLAPLLLKWEDSKNKYWERAHSWTLELIFFSLMSLSITLLIAYLFMVKFTW